MGHDTCLRTGHPCPCPSNLRCEKPWYKDAELVAERVANDVPGKSTNPKKAQGMAKPPMHLIPDAALVHAAMAFKDGAEKYGPFNWRETSVDVSTYVAAARRHLALYFNGQEFASDSGVHNLGGVIACCAILLDAAASGVLVDDRPPAQDLEALMDTFTVGKGLPRTETV